MFTNLDVPSVYRDTAQQAVPATLPRAETATAQRCFSPNNTNVLRYKEKRSFVRPKKQELPRSVTYFKIVPYQKWKYVDS